MKRHTTLQLNVVTLIKTVFLTDKKILLLFKRTKHLLEKLSCSLQHINSRSPTSCKCCYVRLILGFLKFRMAFDFRVVYVCLWHYIRDIKPMRKSNSIITVLSAFSQHPLSLIFLKWPLTWCHYPLVITTQSDNDFEVLPAENSEERLLY